MTRIATRAGAALALALAGCAAPQWTPSAACAPAPRGRDFTLPVRGRYASVHVPPRTRGAVPVVLDLHYLGGDPTEEDDVNELRDAADDRGVAVVQPAGVDGAWNAGRCCGEPWAEGVDDLAFVDEVLDEVLAAPCFDPTRVYATGFSNGAMMTHRLGCELTGRLAAIAPVAAPLTVDHCRPDAPIGVMMIAGTDDPSIPFEGGEGWTPLSIEGDLTFPSSDDSFATWRALNYCPAEPSEQTRQGDVTCRTFRCASDVRVKRCVVDGGGHAWPGGESPLPLPSPLIFGTVSDDLDATAAILDFFALHRRGGALARARSR